MNKINKNFLKMALALVIPLSLQNLINVGVTSADVIMLGNLNETALSGASLGGQINFIMTLIFFGITSGASVLTAQYWGKKDPNSIEQILGVSLRLGLIVSITFTIITFCIPETLMSLFSSDNDVIVEGSKYLRIVCFSYIFSSISLVYLNIMRSVEKVKISTAIYSISLLINIIFNYMFIYGKLFFPALGVQGAAISTVMARVFEVIAIIFYSHFRNKHIKVRFKYLFKVNHLLFKDFIKYSIPVTINELLWGLGTSVNAAIIGQLGSAAAAANSVAQVTRQLATVVSFGFASAAAIMIGKAIGANDLKKANEYGHSFGIISIITGIAASIIVLIVRPIALYGMNLSDLSKGYLSIMMFVMSYFVLCQSFNTTMVVGIFRAGGDTKFGLFIDATFMWCFSILLGAIAAFSLKWSVPIVYIILLSDEVVKIPIVLYRFKSYKWLNDVTRINN